MLLLIVLNISCKQNNQLSLAIQNRFCSMLIKKNDHAIGYIIDDLSRSFKPLLKILVEDVKRIHSWRQGYMDNKTSV